MSDNDEEDVSESGDNVGEYADDDESKERVIEQLRQNGLSLFPGDLAMHSSLPEPVQVELAKAERQNALVQRIILKPHDFSKSSADTMAKYLKRSKRLLQVKLMDAPHSLSEAFPGQTYGFRRTWALCTFLEAIAESTSLKNLSLKNLDLEPACESFENLLIRTKALRDVHIDLEKRGPLEEAATAAIASGFSKNTTLRKISLLCWQETSLISVLTALQMHPVLEVLQIEGFSSFTGFDALVRSKQSQLKELAIVRFNRRFHGRYNRSVEVVAGFESFMLEMGRNTTILKMVIASVPLGGDNIQQLKAMLRRNTVLQDLDLSGYALGSAGLAEIAPTLYRNTSIQRLDISDNGLDDPAAANTLRELLRRNKTITRLSMDRNSFGSNDIVVRIIAEGFRSNTTLQVLDLSFCDLNDQGLSILAAGLGQQKRCLLDLNLSTNQIRGSGLRALVDNATAALSTVTHLNLDNNLILDEGASFLAETLGMQMLSSLKSLQLGHCGISDDGLVPLLSALEENETLETVNLAHNAFSLQGYLALASSLPNIKGLRQINFSLPTTDPSVMPALLEGFRKNSSLHDVNIPGGEHGTYWSQELSFFLYRNKFGRLLQDSDTDDRESLGLWSRALGSVATRPDVLFHVLTSKAGLICATPV
jgi:Ran GTPase-activating protein (RanGAP) involved in mRNA processing and transport